MHSAYLPECDFVSPVAAPGCVSGRIEINCMKRPCGRPFVFIEGRDKTELNLNKKALPILCVTLMGGKSTLFSMNALSGTR
jgi:hypothetical protein